MTTSQDQDAELTYCKEQLRIAEAALAVLRVHIIAMNHSAGAVAALKKFASSLEYPEGSSLQNTDSYLVDYDPIYTDPGTEGTE